MFHSYLLIALFIETSDWKDEVICYINKSLRDDKVLLVTRPFESISKFMKLYSLDYEIISNLRIDLFILTKDYRQMCHSIKISFDEKYLSASTSLKYLIMNKY